MYDKNIKRFPQQIFKSLYRHRREKDGTICALQTFIFT